MLSEIMQVLYSDVAYGACNVCAQRPQRVAGLFPSVGVVPAQHTHRKYKQKGKGSHHLPFASAVATGRHKKKPLLSLCCDSLLPDNNLEVRLSTVYAGGNGDEDDDATEASRQQLSRYQKIPFNC